MVRILCVGIGGYAHVYLSDLLAHPSEDWRFEGIVEPYPEKCEYYEPLKAMNVSLYPTMEAFFAEHEADLALITTPIFLHTRQTLCALEHGCNVMCEKPLSGESADEAVITAAAKKAGKFVSIGFQWGFSPAVKGMKADILAGRYGKPVFLKTLVLWPRDFAYFARGGGWAGKLRMPDGAVVNDSVASNATAHYLYNMLTVTAPDGEASEITDLRCDLVRANNIETFDTCCARFTLSGGGEALYLVSHAVEATHNPDFVYRFTDGYITFNDRDGVILGHPADGSVINYGDPFADASRKVYEAIEHCFDPDYKPACNQKTAAAHVRSIEAFQTNPVHPAKAESVVNVGDRLYVRGLKELLETCFEKEAIPSELGLLDSFAE